MVAKRINNELMKFSEEISQYNINAECYEYKLSNCSANREVGIFLNKNMIVQLDIPNEYPFVPPLVYVANNNLLEKYSKWSSKILNSESRDIDYFLAWTFSIIKNPKFKIAWKYIPDSNCNTCLCCDSITCRNNWTVYYRFSNILIEYLARRDFLSKCSLLHQRLIKRIFNNDNWNLPNDIILHIVNYTLE
jgi:ubiquitin-protein ligase